MLESCGDHHGLTRRTLVSASVAGTALLAGARFASPSALAAYPAILKPTPADPFVDFDTNAEMRWDSVDPRKYLTDQSRLFVRNHTVTPTIDRTTWRLRVFGDGLATPRTAADALSLSCGRPADAASHDPRVRARVHRQRAQLLRQPAGPDRLRHVLEARRGRHRRLGGRARCATCSSTSGSRRAPSRSRRRVWTPSTAPAASTTDGSAGRSRSARRSTTRSSPGARTASRCCPTTATRSAWSCPGWVGIGSIKWLGSLEVSTTELTSPWNTKWYRLGLA